MTGSPPTIPDPADTPEGPILHACERFEWERIVGNVRWRGLVRSGGRAAAGDAKATRGAVAPATVRAIAWRLAQYADEDGSRVMPGDARLAVDVEVDPKQVKAVRTALLALGLLQLVRAGARRSGGTNEYRLTRPDDLPDRVPYLDPAAHERARCEVRDTMRRRRSTGSDGPTKPAAVQGPMDPVEVDPGDTRTGSDGPTEVARTGSNGPVVQGPMDRRYQPGPPTNPTNQREEVRTDAAASARDGLPVDPKIAELGEWEAAQRRGRLTGAALAAAAIRGEVRPEEIPLPPGAYDTAAPDIEEWRRRAADFAVVDLAAARARRRRPA